MKNLMLFIFIILFAGMLVSCTSPTRIAPSETPAPIPATISPTPVPPTAAPTFTSTPKPVPVESMINPGDKIGDMVVTIGQGESVTEIWEFCDPFVIEPGVILRECKVPALQSLFIWYGSYANTTEELDVAWESGTWELFLDDQPVNLPAFGTLDRDEDVNGPVKMRMWNVVLERVTPGKHILRYVIGENDDVWDMNWTFTVASPNTMEIPSGAESLPFNGLSSAFSTLAEFDSLMKSAIASGKVDSFWDAVTATGQMPLVFGDSIAVFLYRGQAERVECRGNFSALYTHQDDTDLWAFIKQLESEARLEYKILLNSSESILDPLNPLTEMGGFGTNSVVRMPEYVLPEFTLLRDDIVHGTLSENILFSSEYLGYDVNYRVYSPVGYETMQSLPVIYVTDGQDFANPGMGSMINALDNLIADGQIKPVMAVFIDPRDPTTGENRREQEFINENLETCPFCDFITIELVPTVDATYKTNASPDNRAILGFSLGGWFTAHMGLVYADVFHLVGIQSPYILSGEWIFDTYQETDRLPIKVFLSHGTYDERDASLRLRDVLEAKDYPLLYIETHEGHSYGSVRGWLDDLLIFFFVEE